MKKLQCFLLMTLVSNFAYAQTSNVSSDSSVTPPIPNATGKIVGPDSKPQVGVPVVIAGPEGKTTAFTDEKGQWSLYNLPPGKYQVKPLGSLATNQQPVGFTVQESKFLDRILGNAASTTYYASDMKLEKNWNASNSGD